MSMKKIGYYDILFFDEASGDVTFFSDEMDIPSGDLRNVKLDHSNFSEDDPKTTINYQTLCLV